MVFSIGSVSDYVYSGISPFPQSVSGVLNRLITNAITQVENYTGDTIGTTSINDKYYPAVSDFATANALRLIAVKDLGVTQVTVGDVSTNNSNLIETAKMFEEMGVMEVKALSRTPIRFYKARG